MSEELLQMNSFPCRCGSEALGGELNVSMVIDLGDRRHTASECQAEDAIHYDECWRSHHACAIKILESMSDYNLVTIYSPNVYKIQEIMSVIQCETTLPNMVSISGDIELIECMEHTKPVYDILVTTHKD